VWGTIELEPEVRDWLESLGTREFAQAAFSIDLLAARGPLLDEPHSRQLRGKLRELRFHVAGVPTRVTYYLAAGRRAVLLTVFVKTARREPGEIRRAELAMERCISEKHLAEDLP
jgi:hypothetical protein